MRANTNNSLWQISKIYSDTSPICLYIDKGNMMLSCHRMRLTTHLHTNMTIINPSNLRNMLLNTGINQIRNKLHHHLPATHNRNLGIHKLNNHITAMAAPIKLCCHNT